MDDKELIARRVALELKPGNLANLGIGLPQSVANYLPVSVEVFFQSENGIIGMEALPEIGMEDPYLTDAGGQPIGAGPGACSLDSCISFGLIRGCGVGTSAIHAPRAARRAYRGRIYSHPDIDIHSSPYPV